MTAPQPQDFGTEPTPEPTPEAVEEVAEPTPEQPAEPVAEVTPEPVAEPTEPLAAPVDPTNTAVRLARAEQRELRAAEARERDRQYAARHSLPRE